MPYTFKSSIWQLLERHLKSGKPPIIFSLSHTFKALTRKFTTTKQNSVSFSLCLTQTLNKTRLFHSVDLFSVFWNHQPCQNISPMSSSSCPFVTFARK